MRYRRADVGGGTYFITANLAQRRWTLLTDHVEALREAVGRVKARDPFDIDAMVVLPDHLHLLMTLPMDDADFSTRVGGIKSAFSRQIPKMEQIQDSRIRKRERGVWQRRFWEHLIRDDHDYAAHVDYIHINPVKHGYVARASDWPHSSIHRYIANGMVDLNWASRVDVADNEFGEDFG